MAIGKKRVIPTSLATTATNILPVLNTSGVDISNLHFCNTHDNAVIRAYVSIVPTGSSMTSGNAILWNLAIGPSGALALSQPMFLASGDTLVASGSAAGLNLSTSYLQLN